MVLVECTQTIYADALLVVEAEEVKLLAVETAVDRDLLLVALEDLRHVVEGYLLIRVHSLEHPGADFEVTKRLIDIHLLSIYILLEEVVAEGVDLALEHVLWQRLSGVGEVATPSTATILHVLSSVHRVKTHHLIVVIAHHLMLVKGRLMELLELTNTSEILRLRSNCLCCSGRLVLELLLLMVEHVEL